MSTNIYIENYTEKSFVVRGDSTEYKEALKDIGGKWNSRLFDKKTQEFFGGWIFWSKKRSEVTNLFNSKPPPPKSNIQETTDPISTKNSDIEILLKELTLAVCKLDPKLLKNLTKTSLYNRLFQSTAISRNHDDDDDDDWTGPPPRRLLGNLNS
jgi:hypothetical protein